MADTVAFSVEIVDLLDEMYHLLFQFNFLRYDFTLCILQDYLYIKKPEIDDFLKCFSPFVGDPTYIYIHMY